MSIPMTVIAVIVTICMHSGSGDNYPYIKKLEKECRQKHYKCLVEKEFSNECF